MEGEQDGCWHRTEGVPWLWQAAERRLSRKDRATRESNEHSCGLSSRRVGRPATAQGFVQLHDGNEGQAMGAHQRQFGLEEITLRDQDIEIVG